MNILNEHDTVLYLLKSKKSIARYGDGEFKFVKGGRNVSQHYDPVLGQRLTEILKNPHPNCMVAIPNVFKDVTAPTPKTKDFWIKWAKSFNHYGNLSKDIQYGSSFITRPDNFNCGNWFAFLSAIRTLWQDEHIVLVHGARDASEFNALYEWVDNAKRVTHYQVASQHAFSKWTDLPQEVGADQYSHPGYEDLLANCLNFGKHVKFVICVGPTSTVLAHDLAVNGRTAWDMGHAYRFWKQAKERFNV